MTLCIHTSPSLRENPAGFSLSISPLKGGIPASTAPAPVLTLPSKQPEAPSERIPPFKGEMSAVKADEGDVFPNTGGLR